MTGKTTDTTKRSPIKSQVKRQAGQGLREYLDSFVDEQVFLAVLPLGMALFWIFLELLNRISKTRIPLWCSGLVLLLTIVNCFVRLRKLKRKAPMLQQGISGERYVAQIIERDLIPEGYRVIHDLGMEKNGRKFNIDHLLIGENGVFCLETKTWSKPYRGETIATYNGSKILLNGVERCGNAVGQARALAKIAEEQIRNLTGLVVKVTPCIVCVGWYVRKTVSGNPEVLVVNEEALAPFVKNCPGSLAPTDTEQIYQRMTEAYS